MSYTSKKDLILGKRDTTILSILKKEAKLNGFKVELNGMLQN